MQALSSPLSLINLYRGWPNSALLPVAQLREAAVATLSDPALASEALSYGPDPGHEPCREAIARWLSEYYRLPSISHDSSTPLADAATAAGDGGPVSADRICITGGASQNLGLMLDVFTDPEYTRNIWIVAPAYMLAFSIFADCGFARKLRAVPEDAEGIDLEFLRREMEASERRAPSSSSNDGRPRFKVPRPAAKIYKHIIYCVPAFSNPSARTMSLARRQELVRLAREFDALVTADDVYDFLQWPAGPLSEKEVSPSGVATTEAVLDRAQLPRLVDVDRDLDGGAERSGADGFGNVCSNGSFSKLAGPGLRVGWVEGTAKFAFGVSQAGIQRSGGAPSQLTSTYVTSLLNSGALSQHIRHVLRPAYTSRHRILTQAIEAELFPLGFALPEPFNQPSSPFPVAGGYFVWLTLPSGLSSTRLAAECQSAQNLIIAPGTLFAVPPPDPEPADLPPPAADSDSNFLGTHLSAGHGRNSHGGAVDFSFKRNVRLCFAWEPEDALREGISRLAHATRSLLQSRDRQETS